MTGWWAYLMDESRMVDISDGRMVGISDGLKQDGGYI